MILAFNIFSISNLIKLTYTKCYTNLSRNLTNYINQQKYFLIWFFNCFYLCQVIKIAWIINRKNFTFATKFIFLIGLLSIKYLQSTKFGIKRYKCYEIVRENCDEYPSVRIPKPKQLNVFNILILPMIMPLLLYFFNHILVFFIALFEFSLKFLTSVHRVTVNHFRIGGGQFHRSFIIRVLDYLFYYY